MKLADHHVLYSEVACTIQWEKHFKLPSILQKGSELLVHDSRPPGEWASTAGNGPGNFPDFIGQASPFVGGEKTKSPHAEYKRG